MSTQARLCQKLITAKRTNGMVEKLAALLSFNQITVEEYNDLMSQLQEQTA